MDKPILCIDFDGVIHSYERGWQGGEIYGTATQGFFDWAMEAGKQFELQIYSSRCKTGEGVEAIRAAMQRWVDDWRAAYSGPPGEIEYTISATKPAAFLTIDDRAICFNGDWRALKPDALRAFKPWNVA